MVLKNNKHNDKEAVSRLSVLLEEDELITLNKEEPHKLSLSISDNAYHSNSSEGEPSEIESTESESTQMSSDSQDELLSSFGKLKLDTTSDLQVLHTDSFLLTDSDANSSPVEQTSPLQSAEDWFNAKLSPEELYSFIQFARVSMKLINAPLQKYLALKLAEKSVTMSTLPNFDIIILSELETAADAARTPCVDVYSNHFHYHKFWLGLRKQAALLSRQVCGRLRELLSDICTRGMLNELTFNTDLREMEAASISFITSAFEQIL